MNIDYAENRKCPKIINEYCWWGFFPINNLS